MLSYQRQYFVYLMFSRSKGYRIGLAKGTRFDGKKDDYENSRQRLRIDDKQVEVGPDGFFKAA